MVSSPARATRIRSNPPPFSVPEKTSSPADFSLGNASPVMELSLIAELPSTIVPSAGTRSPARTRMTLPSTNVAASTSSSTPSRNRRARRGICSTNLSIAAAVRPASAAARYWPTESAAITAMHNAMSAEMRRSKRAEIEL